LRVALLTMMEPTGDTGSPGFTGENRRAFLKVGAMSLARHQLGLVLALGCERVVCLTPAFDGEMVALQHVAESAHASFHVISSPSGLAGLVSAADELIVLGEGLLAWPALARGLLSGAPVVLVQPVEVGLATGFERVDLHYAGAAALRMPGSLVEQLEELPGDVDIVSALQRIALQAGVARQPLPEEAIVPGRWSLVTCEADAHAIESAWIRLHITGESTFAPALVLARRAVRLMGPALLHAGSGATVVGLVALVLALLGLVAGWFGYAAAGLCCCAGSWVLFLASGLLTRVEQASQTVDDDHIIDRMALFGWVMDVVLVVLIAWNVALAPGQGWVQRGFAPVMLLGLVRMMPPVLGGGWALCLADRALLCGTLALAAAFGLLTEAVGLLSLGILGLGLFATRAFATRNDGPQ